MNPRLVEIRSKLDRLKAADPHQRLFGASGDATAHHYREWPRLSAAELDRLELEYQVSLPEELRAFLEEVHGGGPGPGYGFDLWGETPRCTRPFPYRRADFITLLRTRETQPRASLRLPDDDKNDGECWPPGPGFLALAHLGCGVYDAIVVTGDLRGTVWCCDMAWRPWVSEGRLFGFLDWYEAWLDSSLSPMSLARLAAPLKAK